MNGGEIKLLKKEKCATRFDISPEEMIDSLIRSAENILDGARPEKIGISCGGPLDSRNGIILGPPNLPGWDEVHISERISRISECRHCCRTTLTPVPLPNGSSARAWEPDNMVFLTFGTGLGAGLILNGRLYTGTNDNAGEAGHIRLERFGPVGYGKAGSFEGFCSGGGIAKLGCSMALEALQSGRQPAYFKKGMNESDVTAKAIAEAADAGDETAINVYRVCGEHLGAGLSVLIDILNPEKIVIGSVFARSEHLLRKYAEEVIANEALPQAAKCCKIVPAELGEKIGDYAAIATALL